MRNPSLRSIGCFTLGLLLPSLSLADPAIKPWEIPTSADVGQVSRTLNFSQSTAPARTTNVSVPGFTPGTSPVAAARTAFTLNQLIIKGANVYGNAQIENMFRSYVGTRITLADLYQMADRITLKYRNDGYILSKAIIPAQSINNGVVTIQVIEGFVGEVNIQGNPGRARVLLEAYGDKIKQYRPLNIRTLERYTLLANDIPGLKVSAVLSPARIPTDVIAPSEFTPGTAAVTFVVEEHTASGYLGLDNRGTRFLGPNEITAGGNVNSLIRSGDSTGVQVLVTPNFTDLEYIRLYHQTPLGNNGLELNLSASYSQSQPGASLQDLNLKGRSLTLLAGLSYPMIRERTQTLLVGGDFDISHTRTDQDGNQLYDDRINSLRLNANYERADGFHGINQVGGQFSQGISGLGASGNNSNDLSRPQGKSDYTKFNATASRLQALPYNFSLLAAMQGQYALTSLLSAEEFGFGGAQFGQGYDPAEIAGDHGVAGKVELRYDTQPSLRGLHDVQYFTFYDIGKIWNRDTFGGLTPSASAASAGVGLRAGFTHFLSGSLTFAKPLTADVAAEGNRKPRLFFSVTLAGDTPAQSTASPLPNFATTTPPAPTGTGLVPPVNVGPEASAPPKASVPSKQKPAHPHTAKAPVQHEGLTPTSSINSGHYVLQLMSAHSAATLKRFAATQGIADQVNYVKLNNNTYLLVYGRYKTLQDAISAKRQLPLALQGLKPWIRHVD